MQQWFTSEVSDQSPQGAFLVLFFQHHWIQFLLGKERTGINGWMGEVYVWQSCLDM